MLEELAPGGRAPLPVRERQARGRPTHYYMPFFVNFTREDLSFLILLTRLDLERADVKFCNAVDEVVFGLFACTRCLSPRCSASSGTSP